MLRDSACRRVICRVLASAILFAQVTVSAHACAYDVGKLVAGPVEPATADAAAMAAVRPGSDCDMMSESPAGMSAQCAEHCKYGQQADQMQSVTVPALVLTALYPSPARAALRLTRPSSAADTAIAPSPPHAILHCCFRN